MKSTPLILFFVIHIIIINYFYVSCYGLPAFIMRSCDSSAEFVYFYDKETGCGYDEGKKFECINSIPIEYDVNNCGTEQEEILGENSYDQLNCYTIGLNFTCDDEYKMSQDTCSQIYYENNIYRSSTNGKIGECNSLNIFGEGISFTFYTDGEYLQYHYYNDFLCSLEPTESPIRVKLNSGTNELEGTFFECNTNPKANKYIVSMEYGDDDNLIRISADYTNICFENTAHRCYDNQLMLELYYDNSECKREPLNFDFSKLECDQNSFCLMCKDNIPSIDESIFTYFYESMDDCINNKNNSIEVYTSFDTCENERGLLYLKYIDLKSFEIIEYDSPTCVSFENRQAEYGKCYSLSNGKFIKAYINFIPNKPEGIICDDGCSLNSTLSVNETIYVDVNLTLNYESNIVVSFGSILDTVFEVGENGVIIIENATITLDIPSKEDFKILLDTIRSNKSFEIVIINGPYQGSFDSINIGVPENLNNCEKIISKPKEYPDRLAIVFSIDDSECGKGLKWWGILLICEGIVFVLIIVFIILVATVKPIRSYVLPYKGT